MSQIPGMKRLFRFPWRTRGQVQTDVDDELAFHLEQRAADLVARGTSEREARAQAEREFGDVDVARSSLHRLGLEHERAALRRDWLDVLQRDVRTGARALGRNPVFTVTAVLSLALGMGANTAFFSVADALLLRSLPVRAPEELVVLGRNPQKPTTRYTYPEYARIRDHSTVFSGVTVSSGARGGVSFRIATPGPTASGSDAGMAETTQIEHVAGSYFNVLGVSPAVGRVLTPADDREPGANAYAVLSHQFWLRQFAGSPAVVGSQVRLNSTTFTIVGVAAPAFTGAMVGSAPDLFVPLAMEFAVSSVPAKRWSAPDRAWLVVLARRRPDVSTARIAAEVSARLTEAGEEERSAGPPPSAAGAHERNRDRRAVVLPGGRGASEFREQASRPLFVLWAGAALVLLIACANVAGLSFARALTREREMATRLALGATRGHLVRQALTEGVLLSIAAGVVGTYIAIWGSRALVGLLPQNGPPLALDLSPDLRVFGFSVAVSFLSVLIFALGPALRSSRPDLVAAIKGGAATPADRHRLDPRAALVVVQVALSVVLLVGAGLFVRTLHNLKSMNAGFSPERVLVIRVHPEQMGYREPSRLRAYFDQLTERVAATPGVRAVSLADETPLDGRRWTDDLTAEGSAAGEVYRVADLNAVSPGFFATLGIGLRAGRDFTEDDVRRADAEPAAASPSNGPTLAPAQAAVLSATAASRLFPGQRAVGQRFSRGIAFRPGEAYEVVGVVDDARYFGLREAPRGMIYFPKSGGPGTTLLVRTTERPEALVDVVRRHAAAIDPTVPVMDARALTSRVDDVLASERMLAALCTGFGLLAAGLAAVGLYGVLAEGVLRRRREVGIRLALGATRAAVVKSVLRGALGMVMPGAIAGGLAAFALARMLERLLYGVEPFDPWTIAFAAATLVLLAAGAAAGPAYRAAGVNPMTALRQE